MQTEQIDCVHRPIRLIDELVAKTKNHAEYEFPCTVAADEHRCPSFGLTICNCGACIIAAADQDRIVKAYGMTVLMQDIDNTSRATLTRHGNSRIKITNDGSVMIPVFLVEIIRYIPVNRYKRPI